MSAALAQKVGDRGQSALAGSGVVTDKLSYRENMPAREHTRRHGDAARRNERSAYQGPRCARHCGECPFVMCVSDADVELLEYLHSIIADQADEIARLGRELAMTSLSQPQARGSMAMPR